MVEDTKLAVTRGEVPAVILENIKKHFKSWDSFTLNQIEITLLNGLSNSCYRVYIKDNTSVGVEPFNLLYRKFECAISDKKVEATVFKSMSDQGIGPLLYYQNDEYRIESFFDGRPISIWEMRNPIVMKVLARKLFEFNFNKDAISKISAFKPIDRDHLGLDIAIDKWAN